MACSIKTPGAPTDRCDVCGLGPCAECNGEPSANRPPMMKLSDLIAELQKENPEAVVSRHTIQLHDGSRIVMFNGLSTVIGRRDQARNVLKLGKRRR